MNTSVPPAIGPLTGPMNSITGAYLNRSLVDVALVPPGVVTVTSTAPAGSAGATALIEVEDVTVTFVPATAPNFTEAGAMKFVPVRVTFVLPRTGPVAGLTFVIVGAGGV